ncbi:hypothetical protein Brsp05_04454 [Brucella sp. NBRC 12953]|uniref:TIGR02588 family protein n=1 Tax=Brucella sp. NBRC 12953 TaxID=3075481 RepID=UPI0030B42049
MNRKTNPKKSNSDMARVHWSEWLAGALSGLLILVLLGWLAYQSYQYAADEADFRVEVSEPEAVKNGYRVAFTVFNLSQSSAAQVRVVGVLDVEQGQTEQATTTFDYVASEARSSGALFFKNDPRAHAFKLSVASYIDP